MIASLHGLILEKRYDSLILEVGGVGYLVMISAQTLADLPGEGSEIRLLCHTHVREDALQLFGFNTHDERRAFELLISVSGVGPRLALVVLSGMPVGELVATICSGDSKRLTAIPGIGKKTADRLILELRERFLKTFPSVQEAKAPHSKKIWEGRLEVIEALVNLGYKRPIAERVIEKIGVEKDPALMSGEEMLRQALNMIQKM